MKTISVIPMAMAVISLLLNPAKAYAATVTWDGGGGNDTSWHNPRNWSGDTLPAADDDVVIGTADTKVAISSSVSVRGVALGIGVEIAARGQGVIFSGSGPTIINGARLIVVQGAVLSLPGVTNYASLPDRSNLWRADGPGSVLELPNLPAILGTESSTRFLDIQALNGATISLPKVTQITDPTSSGFSNGIRLLSQGLGSVIDLSSLTTFADNSDPYSEIKAINGGAIRSGKLDSIKGATLILDGGSSIPTVQLKQIINGGATANGAVLDLTGILALSGSRVELHGGGTANLANVANIDGASFVVDSGVRLTLPSVTRYASLPDRSNLWRADGPGSVLELPNLPAILGTESSTRFLDIQALNGATISLPKVTQITDPTSSGFSNGIRLLSQGLGSVIDLSSLTTFADNSGPDSQMKVTQNGIIYVPDNVSYKGVTRTAESGGIFKNPTPAIPAIVSAPTNQTVNAGATVAFTVVASGTEPLRYQWSKGSSPIGGATNATFILTSVQIADAGSYSVVVSNSAGSVTSAAAVLTVTTSSSTAFVLRQLPSGYIPGAVLTVQLTATPPAGTQVYAIEDTPPASWPASAISDGGMVDAASGRVKFGPFFDATSRTVSYQLTAPTNPTGRVTFSGTASADGVDSVIGGALEIEPVLAHPADLNTDFRLAISEVTGYGAAWKRSQTWSLPPNPIPISYVTRAGYLWKNGERYRYDTNGGPAPLCWVIAPAGQAAGLVAVSLHAISVSMAVCAISGTNVTLSITPASTVAAYAVQDELPEDFTAAGVSGGGTFDTATRQVKWGPFFDNQARVFTYALVSPTGFSGTAVLTGVASFDGADMAITGDRQYTQGGTPLISQVSRTISTNGGTANITLAAAPASTVAAYAVEEAVPANFTVDNINESGAFDPGTRKVKWGPFFDNTARSLSYRLIAPPGFSGPATIAGLGSFDGTDIPTTGQSQFVVIVGPEQPEYQAAMYGGLVIEGTVRAQYRIDYASSLNEPVQWIPLQTITLTNSPQWWADLESWGQPKRFYKAVVAMP